MSFRFKTSTDIVPLVCVGTYWGPFEYDRLWDCEIERIKEDGGIACDDFDSAKFREAIVKSANRVLETESPLQGRGVVRVRAAGFRSPREYNFRDDYLELEVEVEDDFLDRAREFVMAPEAKDAVSEYIADNWATRDGFFSNMPCQEYGELQGLFDYVAAGNGDELSFGSVLCLVALLDGVFQPVDGYNGLTLALLDTFLEDWELSDFCTVLKEKEWRSLYKGHLVDFRRFRKKLFDDFEKYAGSGVGADSIGRATRFRDRALERVFEFEDETRMTIRRRDGFKETVGALDGIRKRFDKERYGEWAEFWK